MASPSATRLFFSIIPLHSSSSLTSPLKLFFNKHSNNNNLIIRRTAHTHCHRTTTTTTTTASKSEKKNIIKTNNINQKKKKKNRDKGGAVVVSAAAAAAAAESSMEKLKRRTRSNRVFDVPDHFSNQQRQLLLHGGNSDTHVPVMLGEVLEVFHGYPQCPFLHSFVDCTLGAAGHSSAIIRAHPELQLYVGLDVDPIAHEKSKALIDNVVNDSGSTASDMKVITRLQNFKDIKSVLAEVDEKFLIHGVDGILMDLGMSSMQVNNAERGFSVLSDGPLDMRMNPQAILRAEDILNSWPEAEVGRILRDYGEESNWRSLQNKIVKARLDGGLHSTSELVNLIRGSTPKSGGRQGWIKTATRVFQALRIAVNDELKILEDSLYACFDCLSSGGRLAVISFHSLEDRIVKQTFLDIVDVRGDENGLDEEERCTVKKGNNEKETWIKQKISGRNGIILTKRPITPCEEEEALNRRSRSAKLRVVQKV